MPEGSMHDVTVAWLLFLSLASVAASAPSIADCSRRGNDQGYDKESYLYPVHNLKSRSPPSVQEDTVRGLLKRLLPQQESQFVIRVTPDYDGSNATESFLVRGTGNAILVVGTSGTTAAAGVYYYLKTFCDAHVSWSGTQLTTVPKILPQPKQPVKKTLNDKFRYYQNVCTDSYSMVWWNWTRWEREIDWMALNGINLALAFTAQEEIWRRTYLKFGLRRSDLDGFFTGPAFLAWQRMGNVQAWAGPLPSSWHSQQVTLQHKILKRMREFGMIPVLPAFAGHVPRAVERLGARTVRLHWGRFEEKYSNTTFLYPDEALYHDIGVTFLQEYIEEFGTDHAYSADLFNEMQPPEDTETFLGTCAKATFDIVNAADPDGVWLMQNWMFINDQVDWPRNATKCLLTSVPLGRMIVVDLNSELKPWYDETSMYYGQPFIWNMLHNFGGVLGLYGAIDSVNTGPFGARTAEGSTMIGIGLTPEGIEQNDVMYEFMNENAWRTSPVDVDGWVTGYATRRYGRPSPSATAAWRKLVHSVYNSTNSTLKDHGKCALIARPQLHIRNRAWYNPKDIYDAWSLLLTAATESALITETLRYDLVDVTRQSLQLLFEQMYGEVVRSFQEESIARLRAMSSIAIGILLDTETLLASDRHFLLGNWLQDAKRWGTTQEESDLYEFNARNQITLWGPRGEVLDYAAKQWAGLVKGYYYPRWTLFFDTLLTCLETKVHYNQTEFNEKVLNFVEEPFTLQRDLYPVVAEGDSVAISGELHRKYSPLF